MTMHTESYCRTLPDLDRVQAIRAIHEAYLQLSAMARKGDVAASFSNVTHSRSISPMLFVLLATLWHSDGTPPRVYVLDSGLTGSDCIESLVELDPIVTAVLSCEIDAPTFD